MLRKVFVVAALGFLIPAVAQAQYKQGDWRLTLSGTGSSDKDFESNAISVAGDISYFVADPIRVGIRQGFGYADVEDGGSSWTGSTRVTADWVFDLGRWQPFVGVTGGYTYGDDVNDSWVGGPEVGVDWFVNNTTFIFATVAYDFDLQEGLDEGGWQYALGIGYRF
jgi:hypothetical protein